MEWLIAVLIASVGFLAWRSFRRARAGERDQADPAGDTALIAGAWWWSSSGQDHDGSTDSGGWHGGFGDGFGDGGGDGGGGD